MRAATIVRVFTYPSLFILWALSLFACGEGGSSSDTATPAALILDKNTTSFHLKAGETAPIAPKILTIDTNNRTSPAFSISEISKAWLTVASLGITAPTDIQFTVDPTGLGLASGIIHSETVVFTADGFHSASVKVMLSIGLYDIKVSTSPYRSSPIELEGATLVNDAYIFVSPNSDINLVNFFLNTEDIASIPYQIEDEISYDFETTIDETGLARPFDTTVLSNGSHFILVQIVHPDGSINTLRSDFDISN
ncbi:MAG TPA: hypothetical protein VIM85_11980 [Pseudomonadales bacterium]